MAELEKVIKGLECQYEPRMTCYRCDYFIARDKLCNKNKIFREAVDLLKAQEPSKYEYHTDHTDCPWYISGEESKCPVTCSQYRDGWNDAMNYIYKGGNGYSPYKRR